MDATSGAGPSSPREGVDRRVHHHLREMFEHAYRVAAPLLDSSEDSGLHGTAHFLRIVLHEAFPDLHQQDIAILSVSIERVHRERSKPAA